MNGLLLIAFPPGADVTQAPQMHFVKGRTVSERLVREEITRVGFTGFDVVGLPAMLYDPHLPTGSPEAPVQRDAASANAPEPQQQDPLRVPNLEEGEQQ